MRKDACLRPQILVMALQNLGYRRVRGPLFSSSEWKHGSLHLIILDPSKTELTINLHKDVPDIGHSHRSRQNGEDIKKEFQLIMQEYRKLRQPLQAQKIIH